MRINGDSRFEHDSDWSSLRPIAEKLTEHPGHGPATLSSSTHMVLPWPLGAILHNTMDHAAHHIDPAIPLQELPASQKLLEELAPENCVVQRLTWREYLRICRVCKLYDYRRRCWLNFDGLPTTEA